MGIQEIGAKWILKAHVSETSPVQSSAPPSLHEAHWPGWSLTRPLCPQMSLQPVGWSPWPEAWPDHSLVLSSHSHIRRLGSVILPRGPSPSKVKGCRAQKQGTQELCFLLPYTSSKCLKHFLQEAGTRVGWQEFSRSTWRGKCRIQGSGEEAGWLRFRERNTAIRCQSVGPPWASGLGPLYPWGPGFPGNWRAQQKIALPCRDLGFLGAWRLLALGLRLYFKGSPLAVSQAGPPPRLRNIVIFTNMSATSMEC